MTDPTKTYKNNGEIVEEEKKGVCDGLYKKKDKKQHGFNESSKDKI